MVLHLGLRLQVALRHHYLVVVVVLLGCDGRCRLEGEGRVAASIARVHLVDRLGWIRQLIVLLLSHDIERRILEGRVGLESSRPRLVVNKDVGRAAWLRILMRLKVLRVHRPGRRSSLLALLTVDGDRAWVLLGNGSLNYATAAVTRNDGRLCLY